MTRIHLRFCLLVAWCCLCALSRIPAADYPGRDHHGEDWIISAEDPVARAWGHHTGVRRFVVPEGVTLRVCEFAYDAAPDRGTGILEVDAQEIIIAGTINADGSGWPGSGGGAGERAPIYHTPRVVCSGGSVPAYGFPGASTWPLPMEDGWPVVPSLAPGPFSGSLPGDDGGYGGVGVNSDESSDLLVFRGGGGRGGVGGQYFGYAGFSGAGGGGGGAGGGAIMLKSTGRLDVEGLISNRGVVGGDGRAPTSYSCDYFLGFWFPTHDYGISGWGGASTGPGSGLGGVVPVQQVMGDGQPGGAGAGGGVLLQSISGGVQITGTIDLRGGRSQVSNGGTLKIADPIGPNISAATLHSGRIFYTTAPQVEGTTWMLK